VLAIDLSTDKVVRTFNAGHLPDEVVPCPRGQPGEVEEELEYLLHEYTELIRLHKMKYHQSALEVAVAGSLEALEHVVRLNFGKAAKLLFDIKRHKIDYLLQEHAIPKREVAYVAQVKEKFADD
jgi:hypothetical protein